MRSTATRRVMENLLWLSAGVVLGVSTKRWFTRTHKQFVQWLWPTGKIPAMYAHGLFTWHRLLQEDGQGSVQLHSLDSCWGPAYPEIVANSRDQDASFRRSWTEGSHTY